jgi:hypothetical protein
VAEQRYRITFHRGPACDGWTGELTGGIHECHYVERASWRGWIRISPPLESLDLARDFLEAARTPRTTRVIWEDRKD